MRSIESFNIENLSPSFLQANLATITCIISHTASSSSRPLFLLRLEINLWIQAPKKIHSRTIGAKGCEMRKCARTIDLHEISLRSTDSRHDRRSKKLWRIDTR
ncbi:unnamed protein product [Cochlearia groenlandica]